MIHYIIPARKGSKGLPGKNRMLFRATVDSLTELEKENTWVTTDDKHIIYRAKNLNVIMRPDNLAQDRTSMLAVMQHAVSVISPKPTDYLVCLYLTYPDKNRMAFVRNALIETIYNGWLSVIGAKTPKTHPYLCRYADGSPVIDHPLYRRQEYPKCIEVCHAICIMRYDYMEHLNAQLIGRQTRYWDIPDMVDVDTPADARNAGYDYPKVFA